MYVARVAPLHRYDENVSRVHKSNINRTFSFPLDCFPGRVFHHYYYNNDYHYYYRRRCWYAPSLPNPITCTVVVTVVSRSDFIDFTLRFTSLFYFFAPAELKNLFYPSRRTVDSRRFFAPRTRIQM